MTKIKIDLEELYSAISQAKEDGYPTIDIEIIEGEYSIDDELKLSTTDIETNENNNYGTFKNLDEEL